MANPIVALSVGGIICVIVLFSAGVLQPIDCVEDRQLFDKLNNADFGYHDVLKALNKVRHGGDVHLGGITVKELVRLSKTKSADCEVEKLQTVNGMVNSYKNTNAGLFNYCKENINARVEKCVNGLVLNVKSFVKDKLTKAEIEVVERFFDSVPKENGAIIEYSWENFIGSVDAWNAKYDEKERKKLHGACSRLTIKLEEYDKGDHWFEFKAFLHGKKLSYGWFDKAAACMVYLFPKDKDPFNAVRIHGSDERPNLDQTKLDTWELVPVGGYVKDDDDDDDDDRHRSGSLALVPQSGYNDYGSSYQNNYHNQYTPPHYYNQPN